MRDLDHLKDLLTHCAWADAIVIRCWEQAPDREDRELRERLTHSTGTREMFLKEFRGEDDLPWEQILKGEVKPPWHDKPLPDFATLKTWTRSIHDQLGSFAASLDDAASQRLVRIPWFPGCEIPVAEAMVQVAMHTQHHRGQFMTRLKQTGGTPVNVDYIIWLWKGRPVAVWE